MNAFNEPQELIRAEKLAGPSDLYAAMLTVKNGFGNGVTKLGCYVLTKKQAKNAGIEWSFVEQSAQILGLSITNRAGKYGHSIIK